MSCGCENMKKAREIDRTRKLAKALARIEKDIVAIYLKDNGTYGFDLEGVIEEETRNRIIEYITPY